MTYLQAGEQPSIQSSLRSFRDPRNGSRGKTVDELHSYLHQAAAALDQNVVLRILEIAVHRMEDADLSKGEIIAAIEKHMTRA